jgi:hypothetical protein
MLSEIAKFVKDFYNKNFRDIMLFVIVCLLLMLAFASGYIVAKTQQIEPIRIEKIKLIGTKNTKHIVLFPTATAAGQKKKLLQF